MTKSKVIIDGKNLVKVYQMGDFEVRALDWGFYSGKGR